MMIEINKNKNPIEIHLQSMFRSIGYTSPPFLAGGSRSHSGIGKAVQSAAK